MRKLNIEKNCEQFARVGVTLKASPSKAPNETENVDVYSKAEHQADNSPIVYS